MTTKNAITIILLLINISLISSLNQEGLSLLSWLNSSSWNPTHQTPCDWDFIECSNQSSVEEIRIDSISIGATFPTQILSFDHLTVLVIKNGSLKGEIPPSISNLSNLVTLDLSFNDLVGRIPGEIGKLSKLESVRLNSNLFVGEIPREIGNLSKVRVLELYDNQLSGKIPAEIGGLVALEMFRAGGNMGINGEIPMQISSCKELSFIGLANTGVSGQIPSSLGELKRLKTLSIYTANLTGEIPREIGNCSDLKELFLYQNEISGNLPAELGFLKNLKTLLLWQNSLSGKIPESLGDCYGLMVIDVSLNSLSGKIPENLANLVLLEEFLVSGNNISGQIPDFFGNFSNLKQLELDNNGFSDEIPSSIGHLKELSLFYAWQNQISGSIPSELANCRNLQALDLSHNFLTGSVPNSLFNLNNLSQLLLISNKLSGQLPLDIGNSTSMIRLRLGSNNFSGRIPSEISLMRRLSFLELSDNQFTGEIPPGIGNCTELELVDLHGNKLDGTIPSSFQYLYGLNVLDLSTNSIIGTIPENFGKLKSLNKLIISENKISGLIPRSLGLCKDLQLLDLSSNRLTGSIPEEIGQLQGLVILLNFSWNSVTGNIPESFSNLSKLANLDLSHNLLTGSLTVLSGLDNLVSLDVSYNNLSGLIPDTKVFQDLPEAAFSGNEQLCVNRNKCALRGNIHGRSTTKNIIIYGLLSLTSTMLIVFVGIPLFARIHGAFCRKNEEESDLDWQFTPFQKLNFSVDDIVTRLSDTNIVGKGCSGLVYRVETPTKQIIAVKKLWPIKKGENPVKDSFSAEVQTLGSIRHRNIVRFLGCCNNGRTRLLLFDYISNGSLAGLLHERNVFLNWEARYKIILDAAQGLAYLHHDCIPPIIHRDIKANNILVGPQYEAFIADFGLAKLVDSSENSAHSNIIAGSCGYMAPECGYSLRITEKSDVYSFGVVLLEVLTGLEPTDNRIPDGTHLIYWINWELKERRKDSTTILDQQLLLRSSTQIQEMLQVLGVALLCVHPTPEERPTMKDVTAMLMEIRHENNEDIEKPSHLGKGVSKNPQATCSSFSRSSEPLIRSPPPF